MITEGKWEAVIDDEIVIRSNNGAIVAENLNEDDAICICQCVNNLIDAALEILNDFDTYGGVLQVDENGEYGEDSAIDRLNIVVREIERAG